MSLPAPLPAPLAGSGAADLRGAARLATEATAGLTDLVEALHERIARVPGFDAPADGRTRGITGLVYRTIRGVTRVAGGTVDALLSLLTPALVGTADEAATASRGDLGAALPRPQRDAIVAALNGVLGDHLVASGNPLAIPMALRRDGRPLTLERDALRAGLPDAGGALLVMVHGLCMNDLQWSRGGHDHGSRLAKSLGMTPLHLHYNTGRHIADNGHDLALLLERLLAEWPQPVQRLTLLCHSMGGLVARSALAQGQAARHGWPARLADLVFLGTPHHGAPLERAGNGLSIVLAHTPYFGSYTAPIGRLTRLRSAGITDLRHGQLMPHDDSRGDRFAHGPDTRQPVPLPPQVNCCAIAGCLGQNPLDIKARLLGDGLVPLDSALGRHTDPAHALAFAPDRSWVAQGVGHIELLHEPAVADRLREWLA